MTCSNEFPEFFTRFIVFQIYDLIPEWEMTRSNEFPDFFTCFRAFQIYYLRPTQNKLFHLIGEPKTMSIWNHMSERSVESKSEV